jgi:hypothetical protein
MTSDHLCDLCVRGLQAVVTDINGIDLCQTSLIKRRIPRACMIAALALAASLLNPAVHPDTIAQTICRPGYTKTVRPSTSYVRIWKRLNLPAGVDPRSVVVDHIVPLELGGNPSRRTCSCKEGRGAPQGPPENRYHALVCSGRMDLRTAQERMAGWR